MTHAQHPLQSSDEPYGYGPCDVFWGDHYELLLSRGYKLRPRYEPGWVGSWKHTGKSPLRCEDSVPNWPWNVIDAIRIQDNLKISLKLVPTWTEQIPIARYLSSETLQNDHRNRAVPIFDVIALPDDDDSAVLVMPFLRAFDDPPFEYLIECIEALRQMFEGLVFMHEHNIAHRDACTGNIMMDSSNLIPAGFHHAERRSRDGVTRPKLTDLNRLSVAPVDYYFIDFGLSSMFSSFEDRSDVIGIYGQDKSAPELSDTVPYDPFALDIYQLGGVIKELIDNYHGLRIFRPLVESMSRQRPSDRPTASESLQQFKSIVSKISPRALKARVVLYDEWLPTKIWRNLQQSLLPKPDPWAQMLN